MMILVEIKIEIAEHVSPFIYFAPSLWQPPSSGSLLSHLPQTDPPAISHGHNQVAQRCGIAFTGWPASHASSGPARHGTLSGAERD